MYSYDHMNQCMQFVCSYCGPIDWNNKYSYSYSYELTPENIKPSGKIPNIQVVRFMSLNGLTTKEAD